MTYAAPTHRIAENKLCDASRIAPSPIADRMKYMVLPARIPTLDQIEASVPRARACDSTNSTAGPGDRHAEVSVMTKTIQTCHRIAQSGHIAASTAMKS